MTSIKLETDGEFRPLQIHEQVVDQRVEFSRGHYAVARDAFFVQLGCAHA